MSCNIIVQDDRYRGNRGFADATPALLARLILEYDEILTTPETPPHLVRYASAVLVELRAELAQRRAASMTGVAA